MAIAIEAGTGDELYQRIFSRLVPLWQFPKSSRAERTAIRLIVLGWAFVCQVETYIANARAVLGYSFDATVVEKLRRVPQRQSRLVQQRLSLSDVQV